MSFRKKIETSVSLGKVSVANFTSLMFIGATGATGFQGATGIAGKGLQIRGSYSNANDLPSSGNEVGDAFLIQGNFSYKAICGFGTV